jgi:predicted secreted protein
MAKFVLTNPVVIFAGSTVTTSVASVTISLEADDVETTSFGNSGWRSRVTGLKSGTLDLEVHQDFGSSAIDSVIFTAFESGTAAVTVIPGGTAAVSATNPSFSFDVAVTGYTPVDGAVGDLATASYSFPITGAVTRGTA